MKIEIFNVKAGQCAMVHCPNGKKVMIDAGHNADIPWRPSVHFKGVAIEKLIVSNYDEDHVSDLVNMPLIKAKINFLYRNSSVNSTRLRSLKGGIEKMGDGIKAIYEWMQSTEINPNPSAESSDLGDVEIDYYYNSYELFNDSTNNLSVATFFHYGNFTILFPGDLEVEGWEELLKRKDFQDNLKRVNILVASHHGRESGYCEEVFDYCEPEIVIISDGSIKHSTQEKTTGWYEKKASGVTFRSGTKRSVLTTRNDGNITIDVDSDGDWSVTIGT